MVNTTDSSQESRSRVLRRMARRGDNVSLWMMAGLLIALALGATVLTLFGLESRGTVLALRVTARWSFVIFWLAYIGGALRTLFGEHFAGLARRGRELGLTFASAQFIHVGLILWLYQIADTSLGTMTFFWLGIVCTYILAIFSLSQLQNAIGPGIWRGLRTIAVEYIALVFAYDFIFGPLQAGIGKYPRSYLPFAVMLICGASFRGAAIARRFWGLPAVKPISTPLDESRKPAL